MEYKFREIEKEWQRKWREEGIYKVKTDPAKPKYYVLDMFPYPSGAGLHVGHPLGYIASDIYARFKRLKGFNVLHPMGYDAFGLPAEQYALETGQHPAVTTEKNIERYREQLDNIGFCFDWSREVRTSDPQYYKWTQWIFLQLFKSWYNRITEKAEPVAELIKIFEAEGNHKHICPGDESLVFSAEEWKNFDEKEQQNVLMHYRLAYCGYGEVNWCEALGTVLANDEVVNGVSERGGHPVVKKKLRQWYLRITEYADRLLEGLQKVDFSDAMKEMQTNWIGKSYGANVEFPLSGSPHRGESLGNSSPSQGEVRVRVYTTRPDTIFGVDFMVLAPEHELVDIITTPEQKHAVDEYVAYVNSRSERERQAEKKITGCFTGAYALNPFNGKEIPIWISEYVLAGYGTGAIMAVPCGDERDHKFARHFNIPITNIIGDAYNGEEPNPTKEAHLQNSDFLNGMIMKDAIEIVNKKVEEMGIGQRKVNYKMRDAAFSRQRYWGEPFPVKWIDGVAYPLEESELPLELPHVESYKPGPEGEGPLANLPEWTAQKLETNTMPGYAGSSWYFLRYMDPLNDETFASREATDYWNQVDVYVGGTEHAVGHLLYSRLWTKVLYDLGYIGFDEPYRKLINQGMIQGNSKFAYRVKGTNILLSKSYVDKLQNSTEIEFKEIVKKVNKELSDDVFDEEGKIHLNFKYIPTAKVGDENEDVNNEYFSITEIIPSRIPIQFVDNEDLNIEALRNSEFKDSNEEYFVKEDGKYICGSEVEKMSKSKYNVVNPDEVVEQYGADTFRMYEMFLGPIDQAKPWDTKGIEGVHRFLKKLWRLFYDEQKGWIVKDQAASEAELKILHKSLKKIEEDTERFSYNTAISQFMICVNDLASLKCHKKAILEPLLIMLTPYAPHICEELWHQLGHDTSVLDAPYPKLEEQYLIESTVNYPVAINGKTRAEMTFPADADNPAIEKAVLANETVQKWMDGKSARKIIIVKGRMINVVV